MVTTNCITGEMVTISREKDRRRKLIDIVRASSSLLLYVSYSHLCDETYWMNSYYSLMGNRGSAVPYSAKELLRMAVRGNVVILTRNRGYRKIGDVRIPSFVTPKYPGVAWKRWLPVCAVYNEQLKWVCRWKRMEDDGEDCRYPSKPLGNPACWL